MNFNNSWEHGSNRGSNSGRYNSRGKGRGRGGWHNQRAKTTWSNSQNSFNQFNPNSPSPRPPYRSHRGRYRSPPRVPLRPPSPLPGSEEYTQRNIQQASELIKRQLNIDSDENELNDTLNKSESAECSADLYISANTNPENPNNLNAITPKTIKPKSKHKPNQIIDVQEIHDKIIKHISKLSHTKKMNVVNEGSTGYDLAIHQLQKQQRIELSRALRDMSNRPTQDNSDCEVINSIIPDIGIKIEDLPREVIAQLSSTLNVDFEPLPPSAFNLVDPEACFKQAQELLSTDLFPSFQNMDTEQIIAIDNPFDFEYLNKPLETKSCDRDISPAISPTIVDNTVPVITSDRVKAPAVIKKYKNDSGRFKGEGVPDSDNEEEDANFFSINFNSSYLPVVAANTISPTPDSPVNDDIYPKIKIRTDLKTNEIDTLSDESKSNETSKSESSRQKIKLNRDRIKKSSTTKRIISKCSKPVDAITLINKLNQIPAQKSVTIEPIIEEGIEIPEMQLLFPQESLETTEDAHFVQQITVKLQSDNEAKAKSIPEPLIVNSVSEYAAKIKTPEPDLRKEQTKPHQEATKSVKKDLNERNKRSAEPEFNRVYEKSKTTPDPEPDLRREQTKPHQEATKSLKKDLNERNKRSAEPVYEQSKTTPDPECGHSSKQDRGRKLTIAELKYGRGSEKSNKKYNRIEPERKIEVWWPNTEINEAKNADIDMRLPISTNWDERVARSSEESRKFVSKFADNLKKSKSEWRRYDDSDLIHKRPLSADNIKNNDFISHKEVRSRKSEDKSDTPFKDAKYGLKVHQIEERGRKSEDKSNATFAIKDAKSGFKLERGRKSEDKSIASFSIKDPPCPKIAHKVHKIDERGRKSEDKSSEAIAIGTTYALKETTCAKTVQRDPNKPFKIPKLSKKDDAAEQSKHFVSNFKITVTTDSKIESERSVQSTCKNLDVQKTLQTTENPPQIKKTKIDNKCANKTKKVINKKTNIKNNNSKNLKKKLDACKEDQANKNTQSEAISSVIEAENRSWKSPGEKKQLPLHLITPAPYEVVDDEVLDYEMSSTTTTSSLQHTQSLLLDSDIPMDDVEETNKEISTDLVEEINKTTDQVEEINKIKDNNTPKSLFEQMDEFNKLMQNVVNDETLKRDIIDNRSKRTSKSQERMETDLSTVSIRRRSRSEEKCSFSDPLINKPQNKDKAKSIIEDPLNIGDQIKADAKSKARSEEKSSLNEDIGDQIKAYAKSKARSEEKTSLNEDKINDGDNSEDKFEEDPIKINQSKDDGKSIAKSGENSLHIEDPQKINRTKEEVKSNARSEGTISLRDDLLKIDEAKVEENLNIDNSQLIENVRVSKNESKVDKKRKDNEKNVIKRDELLLDTNLVQLSNIQDNKKSTKKKDKITPKDTNNLKIKGDLFDIKNEVPTNVIKATIVYNNNVNPIKTTNENIKNVKINTKIDKNVHAEPEKLFPIIKTIPTKHLINKKSLIKKSIIKSNIINDLDTKLETSVDTKSKKGLKSHSTARPKSKQIKYAIGEIKINPMVEVNSKWDQANENMLNDVLPAEPQNNVRRGRSKKLTEPNQAMADMNLSLEEIENIVGVAPKKRKLPSNEPPTSSKKIKTEIEADSQDLSLEIMDIHDTPIIKNELLSPHNNYVDEEVQTEPIIMVRCPEPHADRSCLKTHRRNVLKNMRDIDNEIDRLTLLRKSLYDELYPQSDEDDLPPPILQIDESNYAIEEPKSPILFEAAENLIRIGDEFIEQYKPDVIDDIISEPQLLPQRFPRKLIVKLPPKSKRMRKKPTSLSTIDETIDNVIKNFAMKLVDLGYPSESLIEPQDNRKSKFIDCFINVNEFNCADFDSYLNDGKKRLSINLIRYTLKELDEIRIKERLKTVSDNICNDPLDHITDDLDEIHKKSDLPISLEEDIVFKNWTGSILVIKVIETTVLAGNDKGTFYFYDIMTGEQMHSISLCQRPITSVCIIKSEDKITLYIGCLDGNLYLVDYESKELLRTVHVEDPIQCMEASWGYIFMGSHKGNLIRYDIKREKTEESVSISNTNVLVLRATQDGSRRVLLVATRNSPVTVRDAMNGLLMRTMEGTLNPTVYTLLFHKSHVYCGTSQHDVLVYTFQDGQLMFKHEQSNTSGVVCMNLVKNLLFVGCYNGNIYIYNTNTNQYIGSMAGPGGLFLSMEVSGHKIVAGTKQNHFKAWTLPQSILNHMT